METIETKSSSTINKVYQESKPRTAQELQVQDSTDMSPISSEFRNSIDNSNAGSELARQVSQGLNSTTNGKRLGPADVSDFGAPANGTIDGKNEYSTSDFAEDATDIVYHLRKLSGMKSKEDMYNYANKNDIATKFPALMEGIETSPAPKTRKDHDKIMSDSRRYKKMEKDFYTKE